MEHPTITLFKPLLAMNSDDDQKAYIRAHPVLVSPYYTSLFRDYVGTLGPDERGAGLRALALSGQLLGKIAAPPSIFLPLFGDVIKAKITEQHAVEVVSKPEVFVELIFPIVNATCSAAEQLARKDWRPAVMLMRLVLAAIDARGARIAENQKPMERCAIETWLSIVTAAVSDVPDGRLYRDALTRGDAIADEPDPDVDPPAQILHRLGVLHLDPYVAGRSSDQLEQQLRAWQWRLDEEYGDSLAGIPSSELEMPRIEDALQKACGYFRRAAARRSGIAKGKTLKALAQALFFLDILGTRIDEKELVASAKEALSLLPAAQFPSEHSELSSRVQQFGGGAENGATPPGDAELYQRAQQLLGEPLPELVKRLGSQETEDALKMTAQALGKARPRLSLDLLLAAQPLIGERVEAKQAVYYQTLFSAVRLALAADGPTANGSPIEGLIEQAFAAAAQNPDRRQRLCYALLWLAVSSTATNQEAEALQAWQAAAELRHEFDPRLLGLVDRARAMLEVGSGANAYGAGDYVTAAQHYGIAISSQLETGQPGAALDMLRRMLDMLGKAPQDVGKMLIVTLAANALALEREGGKAATTLIQIACRAAIAGAFTRGMNSAAFMLAVFVAKGRRFAASLAQPEQLSVLNAPRVAEWEAELAALAAGGQSAMRSAPLDDETILSAFITPDEKKGGATAAEQLRNSRIQFDTWLDHAMSAERTTKAWLPTLEEIRRHLDAETVLMIYFFGQAPSGEAALMMLLVTDHDQFATAGILADWPPAKIVLSQGQHTVESNILSIHVGKLRSALQRRSLLDTPADEEALALLEADTGLFLGGELPKKLNSWHAAGKRHLRISPHGPLHYYPFHLLGPSDAPLAARWCVTVLPNLQLIAPPQHAASYVPSAELSAIGLNFSGTDEEYLAALWEPEPEAASVAEIYAVAPLLGPQVTRKAVLDALRVSKRVHIATHGAHDFDAPSFQCIYVTPEGENPGVIFAYELLKLDLSGLDLVTLSACETALGRFDNADNLRGFPAALLVAGVSTIVGTLWPVDTHATKLFFETFYEGLKISGSKRQAFFKAQQKVRLSFPEYLDWGAFQLLGRA